MARKTLGKVLSKIIQNFSRGQCIQYRITQPITLMLAHARRNPRLIEKCLNEEGGVQQVVQGLKFRY